MRDRATDTWFEFHPQHTADDGTTIADCWHVIVGGAFVCKVQDRRIAEIFCKALRDAGIHS